MQEEYRKEEKIKDRTEFEKEIELIKTIIDTREKLKRDNTQTEKEACVTHNKIGKIVRKAIEEAGRNYARGFAYPRKEFKTIRKRE